MMKSTYPQRSICMLVILFAAALLAGCSRLQQTGGAEPLQISGPQREALEAVTGAHAFSTTQAQASNEEDRRPIRNLYIVTRLTELDVSFLSCLRSLTADRRTLDLATEGAVLSLSLLGTMLEPARAKEDLAKLVAMVTDLTANVDKSHFRNRAMDALARTMVTRRKEMQASIVERLPASMAAYSIVSARSDLNDYCDAGTTNGALRSVRGDTCKCNDKVN